MNAVSPLGIHGYSDPHLAMNQAKGDRSLVRPKGSQPPRALNSRRAESEACMARAVGFYPPSGIVIVRYYAAYIYLDANEANKPVSARVRCLLK